MRKKFFLLVLFLMLSIFMFLGDLKAREDCELRIISLYPAHTENLLRLGAKDCLIGISANETFNLPETENWNVPIFSTKDDLEKFIAAKPDYILIRPMQKAAHPKLFKALETAGIKVYSRQVLNYDDLYEYWLELAQIVDKEEQAQKMIDDFDHSISKYQNALLKLDKRPLVFIESVHKPIKTFVPNSIPIWLLRMAGGVNAAGDAKAISDGIIIADYGPERLLMQADEIDIFISQKGPMNVFDLDTIKERKIYQPIKAFKDDQVYQIDEDLLTRPTPSLLIGLKKMASITGLENILDQENKVDSQTKEGVD